MKKKLLFLFTFLAISSFSSLFAQMVSVEGTVTDDEGDTIVGARVGVKEISGIGAYSDIDGYFKFNVDRAGGFTLVVSYDGYTNVERSITSSGKYAIVLSKDMLNLDDVVITGVVNPKSKISTSISMTTIKAEDILKSSPRTTAEILRTIPGIRSEASGGDGNTNISVRGIPISAGGSKYLQLQEDGLPVLMFGDIAFATSDIFLRTDFNVGRIEAIRGGSASTVASNSPGGIINFISKTGSVEGGSIATTLGLDYQSYRTDFEYGAPIGNGLSFHVGGFLRNGEGPRSAGYKAEQGGQFKANLTKNFKNGYARIYLKHLNDRTPAYMPAPIQVSGTNANPVWESLPGFNAQEDALHSVFLQSNYGIGSDGSPRRVNVADGMHPVTNSIGAEFMFDLGNDWKITSRSRYSNNTGRFVAPFTAAVGETQDMVDLVGGALGRDLTGATLTNAADGSAYTGELAQVIHLFDTELDDMSNLFSDTKVSKTLADDKVTLSAGYFHGSQRVNMSWLWNSYLMEVEGDNAGMIDIMMADSTQLSEDGQFAYGVPVWNCCNVQFNSTHIINAPYAAVELNLIEKLNVEGSFRYDFGTVTGAGSGGSTNQLDVNNNGTIEAIEENVAVINLAQKNPVNYTYGYASYSLGANYMFSDNQALFGRYSRGGSAKADRALFPTGSYLSLGNPKDMINQAELGWKQRFKQGGLFVTAFYAATTEEGGFEASTQQVIENDYQAFGLEVEGALSFKGFDLRGAITYTNAEITSGTNIGNAPRRQPALMYNLIPSYTYKAHSIGLSFIGQSSSFAQDNNELIMPGYFITNAFINIGITKGLVASINANNLLNAIGITESEEGSIVENQVNYIRARSISGRSVSFTLRYNF